MSPGTRRHRVRGPRRRALAAVAAAAAATLHMGATPAVAAPPLPGEIVHTETVRMSDRSAINVSFTEWPIRALQSLDFVFEPTGGIEGRTGWVTTVSPTGDRRGLKGIVLQRRGDSVVLPRHPRARQVWGLDVVSLPEEGTWRFEFAVRGPGGTSTGVLPIRAIEPPGPPLTLSWTIALAPWAPVALLLAHGWRRGRRRHGAEATWSG
ncbi:hypothetical protein Misp01_45090 [Microtetraspora sp. NBRC 13810]|uniref:hypothetical protein n=1 Tax=Microtetraspora sp. NBRC 13810 TaxID=3030990 RepID=UPI0024A14098|nr:hypothetical protein [Microtetraspora sp. NBRC 13810]GLW09380.1 hypothetical protein Misp01_45090 [Microtetraspora sp. NBRC 13810]